MKNINGTMMQYFEWYLDCNQNLWNMVAENAESLSNNGITALWLPPAYKGIGGKNDVGYGTYDLYDLGEFDQKGSIKTKYGSKDEYLNAIITLKQNGIETYADVVLNHKMGADMIQTIPATKVDWANHNIEVSPTVNVKVATKYTFPGRKGKYSNFKWNWTDFDAIDYNYTTGENAIFKFQNKEWGTEVDEENGNYDYLMGANIDFDNPRVVDECINWAKWYLDFTKITGFRLDAVKHIDAKFYLKWIKALREYSKKELFTVGEYWTGDVSKLHRYLKETEGQIELFDVPLHYNFYTASNDENYDISKILDHTLVKENPLMAVTFVDNHDTQPCQALQSFVQAWFKPIAYSIILLRNTGYPCVFYGDYYGIKHDNIGPMESLKTLIKIRKEKAYGEQHDFFDHNHYIGWTREGDDNHIKSGIAVAISTSGDGYKRMYIGEQNAGEKFIDALENCDDEVIVEDNGWANFSVRGKSVSVWVKA